MTYNNEQLKEYIRSLNERLKQENFSFSVQLKYDKEIGEPYIDVFIYSYSKDAGCFTNTFSVIPLTNVNEVVEFIKKYNQP